MTNLKVKYDQQYFPVNYFNQNINLFKLQYIETIKYHNKNI